ncbi:MAG: 4-hydroxyphenylacetate 3-hydroxylase N-terminal domain-containing protein [Pseudomonadota bacterium]|nr:4-hydroxyphenylacetate 3-hydroxylase N-terminal domain-containing protein [Pseudomonadota bacterium]
MLETLRNDGRSVWIDGERVADVTSDSRFAGAARTLAELYDLLDEGDMSYPSPMSGEPVRLSWLEPRTTGNLTARRTMFKRWADHTGGMFVRSPDFLAVMASSFASAESVLGADYGANARHCYEAAREADLAMSHTLINPQVDRSKSVDRQDHDIAARIVRETDVGIVLSGARMLATLSPFCDELLVMPAPSYPLPDTDEGRAYAFACYIPVATVGLKLICRPGLAPTAAGSPMDWPLAARFDEMDAMVVFDEVLVPWERVFIHRNIDACNAIYRESFGVVHMAHQFVTKDLAKAEFMMSIAFALAHAAKADEFLHVQGMLTELINMTETVRACVVAAEVGAAETPFGTIVPDRWPLEAMRFNFPDMFRRACDIVQTIGAGGLMMVPSVAEFSGDLKDDVSRYAQAINANAGARTNLFRLAVDASTSGFAGRQQLYERYFAGDPVRAAAMVYRTYETSLYRDRIDGFIETSEKATRQTPQ